MLRSKFLFLFIAAALQTALWLVALRVDPFGMSSAADRASEDIFLRLYPVLYPDNARDHIQIVMLDEAQLPLKAFGSRQWPLAYDEYTELLQKVLALKPRGVFVDILFDTDEKRDATPLRQFIEALPADAPPVVFAAYNDASKKTVLPEMPFSGKPGLRGLVELKATPHHYQLGTGAGGGAASAAAVLYNATVSEEQRLNLEDPIEFLVAWGNTLHADDAEDSECAPISASDVQSRWNGFLSAVGSGLKGLISTSDIRGARSWERLQPCPYHSEVGASEFFQAESLAKLQKRITGNYVLIGAAIDGSGDTVNSPVHGQLPGVYLHAMALDNLLTFGGRPLVKDENEGLVQGLLIFLAALGGGLVFAERPRARSRLAAAATLVLRSAILIAFASIVVGCVVMFLEWLHVAPYNWGGVIAIGFAVFFAGVGKDVLALVGGGEGS